jgi:hypothetical protein
LDDLTRQFPQIPDDDADLRVGPVLETIRSKSIARISAKQEEAQTNLNSIEQSRHIERCPESHGRAG